MRVAALLALAACWTAVDYVPEPAHPKPAPKQHRIGCWTPEFHESIPTADDDMSECYHDESGDWTWCMMHAYRTAYERQRMWIDHWLESCQ